MQLTEYDVKALKAGYKIHIFQGDKQLMLLKCKDKKLYVSYWSNKGIWKQTKVDFINDILKGMDEIKFIITQRRARK